MKQSLRIFLCHASNDKPPVRKLYELLLHDGYDVWFDEEKLLPGQDWHSEITRAVRSSDIIIACLSVSSVSKVGYVQKEIRFALDMADEQPDNTIFLIPLKLEECEVPERLRRWQWVVVDVDKGTGFSKLQDALKHRANTLGLNRVPTFSILNGCILCGREILHGLTFQQSRLLEYLIKCDGAVIPLERIKEILFDFQAEAISDNAIHVLIRRLRAQIEPDPKHPQYIVTVKGSGYIFRNKWM